MAEYVFDGKNASNVILENLRIKVRLENLEPVMATILVGDDKASKLYTNLKKAATNRIGGQMLLKEFPANALVRDLKFAIRSFNRNNEVKGIMVQLPLPEKLKSYTEEIVNCINPKKDIDGLRTESNFLPATVKAIFSVLLNAEVLKFFKKHETISVLGAKGAVGSRLVKELKLKNYKVVEIDLENKNNFKKLPKSKVVISATGQANVVKSKDIAKNAVIIDIGAPKPEFSKDCYKKASFYTPVPGGVGPMTVVSLMENLVIAAKNG